MTAAMFHFVWLLQFHARWHVVMSRDTMVWDSGKNVVWLSVCLFLFLFALFSFCNYSRHYFDLMDTRLQIFPAKSEATISINQIIHGEGGKEQHPVRWFEHGINTEGFASPEELLGNIISREAHHQFWWQNKFSTDEALGFTKCLFLQPPSPASKNSCTEAMSKERPLWIF